jgi:hypothetical protein
MYSPLGGRILHLMSPSYCCISVKPSVTISKKALEKGYVVQRIYEVWYFDETEQYDPKTKTGGLFTDYVNTFLKMKQEASVWPEWCQSENDKWSYIRDYHEKEVILMNYTRIWSLVNMSKYSAGSDMYFI